VHAPDTGGDNLFGEDVHRLFVVPESRGKRRISHSAQVQIAVERAVSPDLGVAQHRRLERVVRSEMIERSGVHLQGRRRLHQRIGILREERIPPCQGNDHRAPFAAPRVLSERRGDVGGERFRPMR